MLTHRNLVSIIRQFAEVGRDSEAMVTLAFLPMFHIYGFTIVMLYGLVRSAKLVTVPRFESDSFVKALQNYRVTHLFVVPPIAQFLAMHPLVDAHDLSSLVFVGCGAGIDVGRDVPGEIWFRGPQAFKGYLNRPDATAETCWRELHRQHPGANRQVVTSPAQFREELGISTRPRRSRGRVLLHTASARI